MGGCVKGRRAACGPGVGPPRHPRKSTRRPNVRAPSGLCGARLCGASAAREPLPAPLYVCENTTHVLCVCDHAERSSDRRDTDVYPRVWAQEVCRDRVRVTVPRAVRARAVLPTFTPVYEILITLSCPLSPRVYPGPRSRC